MILLKKQKRTIAIIWECITNNQVDVIVNLYKAKQNALEKSIASYNSYTSRADIYKVYRKSNTEHNWSVEFLNGDAISCTVKQMMIDQETFDIYSPPDSEKERQIFQETRKKIENLKEQNKARFKHHNGKNLSMN